MGKKPGTKAEKKKVSKSLGFDASVPCGHCGAPSRVDRGPSRICEKGHHFWRKRG